MPETPSLWRIEQAVRPGKSRPLEFLANVEDGLMIVNDDCRWVMEWDIGRVDMVVTDPPYGMGKGIEGDGRDYLNVVGPALKQAFDILVEGGSMFIFCSPREVLNVGRVLPKEAFNRVLWMFKLGDVCHKHYNWMARSEAILWFSKGKPVFRKRPVVLDTYMVHHDLGERGLGHPAVKPLSVVADLVMRCPEGGVVLDPFMGTGTTLVACRYAGVRGIGIEIERKHCETAMRRLSQRLLPLDIKEPGPEQLELEAHVGC